MAAIELSGNVPVVPPLPSNVPVAPPLPSDTPPVPPFDDLLLSAEEDKSDIENWAVFGNDECNEAAKRVHEISAARVARGQHVKDAVSATGAATGAALTMVVHPTTIPFVGPYIASTMNIITTVTGYQQ